MAEPASLAERAGELAGDAGALANNLELSPSTWRRRRPRPWPHGGTPFVFVLTVFVLACFVGYYVVWRVTPALHSPLMSVTNAISSVIIVGALIAAGPVGISFAKIMGFIAVTLAAVNIFGGFIVTQRMLQMFKKKTQEVASGGPAMSESLSAFLYLIASICFIMALRGLSSPETARGGNLYGIAGMVIAIGHDAGDAAVSSASG